MPDGGEIEFWIGGIDGSKDFSQFLASLRGYSSQVPKLFYELAKAGDMTVIDTGNSTLLLTNPSQQLRMPTDLVNGELQIIEIESAERLDAALSSGYAGWKEYRDHVVKGK